jgi:hypothetical protein
MHASPVQTARRHDQVADDVTIAIGDAELGRCQYVADINAPGFHDDWHAETPNLKQAHGRIEAVL